MLKNERAKCFDPKKSKNRIKQPMRIESCDEQDSVLLFYNNILDAQSGKRWDNTVILRVRFHRGKEMKNRLFKERR